MEDRPLYERRYIEATVVGITDESGVAGYGYVPAMLLEADQLHFAASTPNLMGGAEIGEFEGLSDDPASDLVITKGCLKVSDTASLGVEIDLSKARETTI